MSTLSVTCDTLSVTCHAKSVTRVSVVVTNNYSCECSCYEQLHSRVVFWRIRGGPPAAVGLGDSVESRH